MSVTTEQLKEWAKIAAAAPDELKQKYREADIAYADYMEAAGVPAGVTAMLIAGWHERRCTQIMDAIAVGMIPRPKDDEASDEEE